MPILHLLNRVRYLGKEGEEGAALLQLPVDEKAERLREQIESAQRSAGQAHGKYYSVERILQDHKHDSATGEVLLPARRSYGDTGAELSAYSRKDEEAGNCYF